MDLTHNVLSDVITLSEIDQNFSDVVTAWGSLTQTDLERVAGIGKLQLASRYQDTFYTLGVRAENLAAGWPANTVVDSVPFQLARNTIAIVCQISVVNSDIGNSGVGTFVVGIRDPLSSTQTLLVDVPYPNIGTGGANTGDTFDYRSPPHEFDDHWNVLVLAKRLERQRFDTVGEIYLESRNADAAALTAAGSFLTVTVMVRRYLRSS